MFKEIELYFGGNEPYFTVHPVEVTCGTELMNLAHSMLREQRADFITFGPAFERDADGLPAYNSKKRL